MMGDEGLCWGWVMVWRSLLGLWWMYDLYFQSLLKSKSPVKLSVATNYPTELVVSLFIKQFHCTKENYFFGKIMKIFDYTVYTLSP